MSSVHPFSIYLLVHVLMFRPSVLSLLYYTPYLFVRILTNRRHLSVLSCCMLYGYVARLLMLARKSIDAFEMCQIADNSQLVCLLLCC